MNPEWDVILSASQKNRPVLIRDYVTNRGISPSHANAVGQSALHIASLWGHVDAVQTLVELGANVNAQNNMTGATPLHMVAQSLKGSPKDRLAVIDILVNGGAAVDQVDNYGSLPVQVVQVTPSNTTTNPNALVVRSEAVEVENQALLQTFIDKLQPKRPELHSAILDRDMVSVETLCAAAMQASSTSTDMNHPYKGISPLSYSVNELLEVINTQAPNDARDDEMRILVGIIELLVRHGATVQDGSAAVETSSANALLMASGETVDTDLPLSKVVTAIRAVAKGNSNNASSTESTTDTVLSSLTFVVTVLVDHGATASPDTALLLHQAARFNERWMVEFLIHSLHIDPNTKGRQGLTPLHFAARSGRVEMVEYLLSVPGIDKSITDDRGSTALDAARVNQKDDVVRLLEE